MSLLLLGICAVIVLLFVAYIMIKIERFLAADKQQEEEQKDEESGT